VKDLAWEVAAGVFAVALVYVLVRPDSNGPSLVTAVTGGVADVITFAVGG
jgi:hypothetical protein